jgi:hypothetical protein
MNINFAKVSLAALTAAVSAMSFGQYGQVSLNPGSTVSFPEINSFINSPSGLLTPFTQTSFTGLDTFGNIAFTGVLTSYVFSYDNAGDLAFDYHVSNDSTSVDAINHFSVTDFTGFATAVADDLVVSGPPSAYFASRSASGDVVSFSYLNLGGDFSEIAPGQTSSDILIFTDAKAFTKGSAQISDGGVATVETYAPQAVPEPVSMSVLALGVATMLRRRKNS